MTIEQISMTQINTGTLQEASDSLKAVDLRTLPKDARQPVKDAREAVKAALKALKG